MTQTTNNKVLKSSQYKDIFDAKETLLKAQNQAQEILSAAQQTQHEAYFKGYQEGFQKSQFDNIDQTIKLVAESVEYLGQIEQDITHIIFSSIKKIIASYEPDELAIQAIKLGVKELANSKKILLRASPELAKILFSRIAEIDSDVYPINLVTDERLEDNNCTLESDVGVMHINATDIVDKLQQKIEACLSRTPTSNHQPC